MTYYSALHYAAKAEKSASEAATYNFKRSITNCITEIPQDIKLEFNNGTLTLKAGSKVYVPNGKNADGSNKFDEVVIAFDLSTAFDNNNQKMVFVNPARNGINHCNVVNQQSSGETSTSTSSYNFWYDTTSNNVKLTNNSGSTWTSGYSLPICLVTKDSGIDQVFNGFGYIGSTIYALPGVKGLIPNGRNADGSLNNTEFTTQCVLTNTYSSATGYYVLRINNGNSINATDNVDYDEPGNLIYIQNTVYPSTVIGNVIYSAGVITSFQPKLQFRAVDYSDSSWVSAQAMPSGKYIDLTLGASGSTYTAPANGYFAISKPAGGTGQFHALTNVTAHMSIAGIPNFVGAGAEVFIPAKRNDKITVHYTTTGTATFRFLYAEGEN